MRAVCSGATSSCGGRCSTVEARIIPLRSTQSIGLTAPHTSVSISVCKVACTRGGHALGAAFRTSPSVWPLKSDEEGTPSTGGQQNGEAACTLCGISAVQALRGPVKELFAAPTKQRA